MKEDILVKIFNMYELPKEEQIQRVSLIRIVLYTCLAGLAYSAMYMYMFNIWDMADVVLTYISLSSINLFIFYLFNNYNIFRAVQLFYITLLPILTQLFIGGFMASSAVGVSGILAPIGALLFYNIKAARVLLICFVFLLAGAGYVEYNYLNELSAVPRKIEIIFFVIILGSTSSVIYFLLEYVFNEKNKISEKLKEMYQELEYAQEEVNKQNIALLKQQDEIVAQRDALEEKNRTIQKINDDIKSSINYASTIQTALLPGKAKLRGLFDESFFTFYKPRDVVSGDFYWCEQIEDKIIMVTSDCTGHGVPGAFMSMLGVSGLNQIVFQQEITSPELILNSLHDYIFNCLHQEEGLSADGMDISVVVIDTTSKTIEFAGAMNPLYYITESEVIEVKGDKQPIGGSHYGVKRDYKKSSLDFGDIKMLYLASDGYQDQFGGKDNKKFMKGRFKSELQKMHHLPASEQKMKLEEMLLNWMNEGEEKQIDDILVVGIKINA